MQILHLTDWLEEKNIDFDVVTDEDLHIEGVDMLNRYRCVLTGHIQNIVQKKC